jgi:transposase InsO family protein
MPFEDWSAMSQKREFVGLALAEGANMSALCRRFGIGRTSGYKLLQRYRVEGEAGLAERSRRPAASPLRTAPELEAAVLAVRAEHPAWGGRKIAGVLARRGRGELAPSTVTAILRRNGIELGAEGGGARPFIRFEHAAPNDLWQMDFKGHVGLRSGRVHPLTVLDDHSRYSLVLAACADQTTSTVKAHLVTAFGRYGLPWRIATDNGAPWGDGATAEGYTPLVVWLLEAGVAVSHSRPYHPQTLGKDERFHRSMKAEILSTPLIDLAQAQQAFDRWRRLYNTERPHDGLAGGVPIERFTPSPRDYSDIVTPFEYASDDTIRRVHGGVLNFRGRRLRVPKAFAGKTVALRPTRIDGVFELFFRHHKIRTIDLHSTQVYP